MLKLLLNEEVINVRWTDMDAYNHVAHQKYFDYLTETRHAELVKPYLNNQEENFFLVDIACEFKKPLVYPDQVIVKQYLIAKGNSSFTVQFEFLNEQQKLCATALATLVSVDAKSHKKVAIPEYLQRKFSAIQLPEKYIIEKINIDTSLQPLLTEIMPTRYADMDAFRHINNSRYFDYMLEARHALFKDNNPLNASCYFFIINARCGFYKPLFYPGKVEIKLYLTYLGRSSFTFGYKIYSAGNAELAAEGLTTLVCVDKQKLTPIKVPEELLPIIGK